MHMYAYRYMYVFMSEYVCVRDYIRTLCYSKKDIQLEAKKPGSNQFYQFKSYDLEDSL